MNFKELTDANIVFYAIRNYDNPQSVDMEEFQQDFKRVRYLKRLFSRYERSGDLQTRLILNHIIVLYNVFGLEAATRILFFALDTGHYKFLKPFLVSQGYINPSKTYSEWGLDIVPIPLDRKIVEELRGMLK